MSGELILAEEGRFPWPCVTVLRGQVYKCTLPHCVKCGSHYRKPDHTEVPLCNACEAWARFYLNAPGASSAFERFSQVTPGRGIR